MTSKFYIDPRDFSAVEIISENGVTTMAKFYHKYISGFTLSVKDKQTLEEFDNDKGWLYAFLLNKQGL